jgi:hypothetical protein
MALSANITSEVFIGVNLYWSLPVFRSLFFASLPQFLRRSQATIFNAEKSSIVSFSFRITGNRSLMERMNSQRENPND